MNEDRAWVLLDIDAATFEKVLQRDGDVRALEVEVDFRNGGEAGGRQRDGRQVPADEDEAQTRSWFAEKLEKTGGSI